MELEDIEQSDQETLDLAFGRCLAHTKKFCAFCSSCDKAICLKCLLEGHRDHDFQAIDDIDIEGKCEEIRTELLREVNDREEAMKESLENHQKILEDTQQKLCKSEIVLKTLQEELFAKVESLINQCETEIKINFEESNNKLLSYINTVSIQRQENEAKYDKILLLFGLIEGDYPNSSLLLAKAIKKNVQFVPRPKAEDFPQNARQEDTSDFHNEIQGLFEKCIDSIQKLLL